MKAVLVDWKFPNIPHIGIARCVEEAKMFTLCLSDKKDLYRTAFIKDAETQGLTTRIYLSEGYEIIVPHSWFVTCCRQNFDFCLIESC